MSAKRKGPKVVYRKTYVSPGAKIGAGWLPSLPHLADGTAVIAAYIETAGRYEDGTEFQTLRVIVQPNGTDVDRS